jgi:hypothetical protein
MHDTENGGWQPVETCPNNTTVLVYAPDGERQTKELVTQCFHFRGGDFVHGFYSTPVLGVTLWMPMPKAPDALNKTANVRAKLPAEACGDWPRKDNDGQKL